MTPVVPTPDDAVEPATREVTLTADDFKADFDVEVVYKGNTYTLRVLSKSQSQGAYGVRLTETIPATPPAVDPTTSTLAEFAISDASNWAVGLSLPPGLVPTIAGVTVKDLSINFGEGTVTFPS